MAVQNSKSRGAARLVLSRAIEGPNAHPLASHTATGGSTTTLVDSKYAAGIYADDYFNGDELVNQTKAFTTFITDWTQSSGTATIPTNVASASGDVYEFHRRAGPLSGHYNDAIDLAVQAAAHASALSDKASQALAFQLGRSLYPIPSGFSYLHRVQADMRVSGQYIARHAPSTFDTIQPLRSQAAYTKLAQSFKVSGANPSVLTHDVYLLLNKVASPASGTLTVQIETDSSGAPSGTAVGTSVTTTVDPSTDLQTAPTFQRFPMATSVVLTANTTYWLVLSGTFTIQGSNHVGWAMDTGAGYSLGSAMANDGASWSALTGDFVFTVRSPYPELVPMKPRIHYEVIRDTTRYLHLTERGREDFGLLDGAVLYLEGQGAPALPTADSSTLEIPYDYAVARAGLHLATQFKDYLGPQANALMQSWGRLTDDLEKKLGTVVHPGSLEIEAL